MEYVEKSYRLYFLINEILNNTLLSDELFNKFVFEIKLLKSELNNNGGIDTFKCIFNDGIVIRIQFVEYSSCGTKKIFMNRI